MMDQRGKHTTLVVITILVCLIGLGVLNYVQTKANPTEAEQQEQQQQQQTEAQAKAKAAAAKAATSAAKASAAFTGTLPSEVVIGNPATAKIKVTIGYTYDDAIVKNPVAAHDVIQAVQDWAQAHPNDSAQIVCLDVPKDQLTNPADASVPLGMTVQGSLSGMGAVNPGQDPFVVKNVQQILTSLP